MKHAKSFVFMMLIIAMLAMVSIAPVMAQEDALVIWADGERAPLLVELGAQFTEEFGIPVEVLEIGLGEARDDLLNFGPAGEGPDVMITAHDSLGLYLANGAIVPIDITGLEDQFSEAALNLFTLNDTLWGIPYAIENVALIRNVDLVPEAPATWQEVREIAEQLQESGEAQYGFLVQTGNTYHNFPITSAFGGYIFGQNEDGSYNVADIGLNSEGGLAAAEWLSGMYNDGLMATDVNDDVVFELFTAGDAAMFITGPWFSQRIVDTGVNYSIDPLPGAEGGLEVATPFSGGQGFVISAFSEQQLLAETFLLDFVATDEFMQAIFDNGGRPPAWVNVDTSAEPNISSFLAAGATAVPMPAIPEMGSVWSASDNALTLISQGDDPVASMDTAVVQIGEAIELAQSDERIVVVAGNLQDEAGCDNEWDPACLVTQMEDQGDGIFTLTVTLPAGDYEYKVAMSAGWDENYGANGEPGGANIMLSLAEETEVTFTYDDNTNIVTDSVNEG